MCVLIDVIEIICKIASFLRGELHGCASACAPCDCFMRENHNIVKLAKVVILAFGILDRKLENIG